MPEYRQDPLSLRWVIVGSERAARPQAFVERTDRRSDFGSPCCAGHEDQTPTPIQLYPGQNGRAKVFPGQVRVVPKKYPAVSTDIAPDDPAADLPGVPGSNGNGSLHRHRN